MVVAQASSLQSLPNELLDLILSYLPTPDLLSLTPVSKHIHHHTLLAFHTRLVRASTLDSHVLILECYHPSAKLVASSLYCTYLGTDGLSSPFDPLTRTSSIGHLSRLNGLYSRFLPQRKQPENVVSYTRKHPAGDVRGSRTFPDPAQTRREEGIRGSGLLVTETVNLDANELFSQLCCVTNLVKLVPGRRGLFSSIVEVSDGIIRVFRDWLAQKAKGDASSTVRSEQGTGTGPGHEPDDDVLWVNSCDKTVGIKFRVKERHFRRDNPVLYESEEEVAVSYYVEFEELRIKTTYLLEKIERSREQQSDFGSGKAIVFGSTLSVV